jgi:hypothetical protein
VGRPSGRRWGRVMVRRVAKRASGGRRPGGERWRRATLGETGVPAFASRPTRKRARCRGAMAWMLRGRASRWDWCRSRSDTGTQRRHDDCVGVWRGGLTSTALAASSLATSLTSHWR